METYYYVIGLIVLALFIYFGFLTPKKLAKRKQKRERGQKLRLLRKKYSGRKLFLDELTILLDEDGNPIEELNAGLVWFDIHYQDSIFTPILPVEVKSIILSKQNFSITVVIRSDPFQFEVKYVGDKTITVKSTLLGEMSFINKGDFSFQNGDDIIMIFVATYNKIRALDLIKPRLVN